MYRLNPLITRRMSFVPVRKEIPKTIVFVNGSTGTGKTQLSVAIAQKYSGEIVNADAMQLYKGLDIVTNKVTEQEKQGVPHHMLNVLEPTSLSYTIHDYKRSAKTIISDIFSRNKLPVVVGGTNYYVDSLIWQSLIPKHEDDTDESQRFEPISERPSDVTLSYMKEHDSLGSEDDSDRIINEELVENAIQHLDTNYLRLNIDKVNCRKLHKLLEVVDPETSRKLHPNHARKIIRAVEVYKHHGKPQSKFVSEINSEAYDQTFGAQLCYENAVVLWLNSQQDVLDKRLDERVNKMMDMGLLDELDRFHTTYNKKLLKTPSSESGHADYTRGVFQCIGFKEFHEYLQLSQSERMSPDGQKVFEKAISDMKTATRRYARYQNKWVRKRFFEDRNKDLVPPVYSFDSTNAAAFQEEVVDPALTLLEELMQGKTPTKKPLVMPAKSKNSNPAVFKTCEACNVLCVYKVEWDMHCSSKKHHKRLSSLRKQQARLDQARLELSQTLNAYEASLASDGQADNTSSVG